MLTVEPFGRQATAQDLLSLDWSQFQYDSILPFMDDTGTFETGALLMPDPTIFQPLPQQV